MDVPDTGLVALDQEFLPSTSFGSDVSTSSGTDVSTCVRNGRSRHPPERTAPISPRSCTGSRAAWSATTRRPASDFANRALASILGLAPGVLRHGHGAARAAGGERAARPRRHRGDPRGGTHHRVRPAGAAALRGRGRAGAEHLRRCLPAAGRHLAAAHRRRHRAARRGGSRDRAGTARRADRAAEPEPVPRAPDGAAPCGGRGYRRRREAGRRADGRSRPLQIRQRHARPSSRRRAASTGRAPDAHGAARERHADPLRRRRVRRDARCAGGGRHQLRGRAPARGPGAPLSGVRPPGEHRRQHRHRTRRRSRDRRREPAPLRRSGALQRQGSGAERLRGVRIPRWMPAPMPGG